jgi:hypothetical protein
MELVFLPPYSPGEHITTRDLCKRKEMLRIRSEAVFIFLGEMMELGHSFYHLKRSC